MQAQNYLMKLCHLSLFGLIVTIIDNLHFTQKLPNFRISHILPSFLGW